MLGKGNELKVFRCLAVLKMPYVLKYCSDFHELPALMSRLEVLHDSMSYGESID
jgi:hypothetical protein